MAGTRFGKLSASSGTSALLRQYVRSRNIKLSFQTSPYSNCPSCRIRVADLLAPRSRVCACLDELLRPAVSSLDIRDEWESLGVYVIASLQGTTVFNGILQSAYHAFAIPVAEVAKAFQIDNFTPVPAVNLPLNVFLTLSWTWMGAPPPLGPNIHPNSVGYAAVAG